MFLFLFIVRQFCPSSVTHGECSMISTISLCPLKVFCFAKQLASVSLAPLLIRKPFSSCRGIDKHPSGKVLVPSWRVWNLSLGLVMGLLVSQACAWILWC